MDPMFGIHWHLSYGDVLPLFKWNIYKRSTFPSKLSYLIDDSLQITLGKKNNCNIIVVSAGQSLACSSYSEKVSKLVSSFDYCYHVIEIGELFSVLYHLKEKFMFLHLVKVSFRYLYWFFSY